MDFVIENIMYWLPTIVTLYVLIAPKGKLTYEILRSELLISQGSDSRLGIGKSLSCYIPMYNTVLIKKAMYDKAGVYPILYLIIFLLGSGLVTSWFLVEGSVEFYVILNLAILADIIFLWVIEALVVLDCAIMFRANMIAKTVGVLIPPLGAQITAGRVYIALLDSKEDIDTTFEGGKNID